MPTLQLAMVSDGGQHIDVELWLNRLTLPTLQLAMVSDGGQHIDVELWLNRLTLPTLQLQLSANGWNDESVRFSIEPSSKYCRVWINKLHSTLNLRFK